MYYLYEWLKSSVTSIVCSCIEHDNMYFSFTRVLFSNACSARHLSSKPACFMRCGKICFEVCPIAIRAMPMLLRNLREKPMIIRKIRNFETMTVTDDEWWVTSDEWRVTVDGCRVTEDGRRVMGGGRGADEGCGFAGDGCRATGDGKCDDLIVFPPITSLLCWCSQDLPRQAADHDDLRHRHPQADPHQRLHQFHQPIRKLVLDSWMSSTKTSTECQVMNRKKIVMNISWPWMASHHNGFNTVT